MAEDEVQEATPIVEEAVPEVSAEEVPAEPAPETAEEVVVADVGVVAEPEAVEDPAPEPTV